MTHVHWALLTTVIGTTPADEVRAALADLAHVAPAAQATTRYLSLANLPATERERTVVAVDFVLNAVSRGPLARRVERVAGTSLLRWNLLHYAADEATLAEMLAAYEQLASEDPYWHLRTEVLDPRTKKRREVFTDGGWTDLAAAAQLRAATGSAGALLRADWFIAKVAAPPHYYRLAGVPATKAEFLVSLGLDTQTIERLGADDGANLLRSNITRQVRRIVRRQGPLGGAWETFDVARSTAERDPFRNPFGFRFDAGEDIAAKPNGMHVYALFDAAGRRADAVPPDIARDDSDPHGDGQVVPLLSCVRCHVEDGLRPFVNDQRRLLEAGVDLLVDDPRRAGRLAQFYGGDRLARHLARDREDYAAAVVKATGVAPREAGAALAAVYRRQVYELVSPAMAAAELGAGQPATALAALRGSHDPVLLALATGLSVQRAAWEASFAEAALRCAGQPPPVHVRDSPPRAAQKQPSRPQRTKGARP